MPVCFSISLLLLAVFLVYCPSKAISQSTVELSGLLPISMAEIDGNNLQKLLQEVENLRFDLDMLRREKQRFEATVKNLIATQQLQREIIDELSAVLNSRIVDLANTTNDKSEKVLQEVDELRIGFNASWRREKQDCEETLAKTANKTQEILEDVDNATLVVVSSTPELPESTDDFLALTTSRAVHSSPEGSWDTASKLHSSKCM